MSQALGRVQNPGYLTREQYEQLASWMPPSEEIPTDLPTSKMLVAGYERNTERMAQLFGPHLVAKMVELEILQPDEDPVEVLVDLWREKRR